MKRYFGLVLVIAGILIGAVMSYRTASDRAQEAQRTADFTRLQKDYLERVGWMRTNPDEASYRQEVSPFFKAYFEQVSSHQDRYRLSKEFDAYLAEVEKSGDEQSAEKKKAEYEYTRKVFDQMREGRYKPVWTATDKGMRLDVLSSDVVMVLNKPQVRLQLVLWGAQREERLDEKKKKKMVTHAAFKTQWKLTDARGKLLGEMNADDPSMKIAFPERYIAEFPPQMVLGHYDMDLVPNEVKKMDITFNVSSRAASGGDVTGTYVWKLDVPADWRLGAGQKWEGAEVTERSEEEIDPSKAGK